MENNQNQVLLNNTPDLYTYVLLGSSKTMQGYIKQIMIEHLPRIAECTFVRRKSCYSIFGGVVLLTSALIALRCA